MKRLNNEARHHMGSWLNPSRHPEAAEPYHHKRSWLSFNNMSEAKVNSLPSCPPAFRTSKKIAFTLAEVLITLAIIGVVAAMSIPTLISNYQKKQTVSQLKKAYSEISQAIHMAQVEHGTMETWNFADFDNAFDRASYFYKNYFIPNLKVIKTCLPSTSECWADDIKTISGNTASHYLQNNDQRVSIVTASGYSIFSWMNGDGSGGWFWVDLNGPKKPNKIGKDIFAIGAGWKTGIKPAGLGEENSNRDNLISGGEGIDSQYLCNKNSTGVMAGGFCGAVILLDGWKISDDYPW